MVESLSRPLYKIELYLIKVVPIVLSGIALLNTVLSYFYIDIPLLSYLGGVSVLTILFLYISSYAFRFCNYHRMFIHYITVNWILNIIDYYIGIPVSDKGMFLIYLVITGIVLFIVLYEYISKKNNSKSSQGYC